MARNSGGAKEECMFLRIVVSKDGQHFLLELDGEKTGLPVCVRWRVCE